MKKALLLLAFLLPMVASSILNDFGLFPPLQRLILYGYILAAAIMLDRQLDRLERIENKLDVVLEGLKGK